MGRAGRWNILGQQTSRRTVILPRYKKALDGDYERIQ